MFKLNIEQAAKNIKKLTSAINGKDESVFIIYEGNGYGVSKPWTIRCDAKEAKDETIEGAAKNLINQLKSELAKKIAFNENQSNEYKKVLGALEN
jgi:hypothetical protein